ncbi:MAG TPA: beta-L-arabinofuranosidase domain-containing protein, partial [Verrucomicrobiae bacterium]|nr:beta-L-arabinofuranosidase domain-containing protein [Verrucomicrobiae bacterium]
MTGKRIKLGLSILGMVAMLAGGVRADVKMAVDLPAQEFAPQDVRLLDGPFKDAMERDAHYLLGLEPDRLLSGFRTEAGLPPKAGKYGGWESQGIAGHTLGHYLSACARMYQDTGNPEFLNRVSYVVDQLAECQKANGNGYVAAIPNGKAIFAEVARGEIRSQDFNLDGAWVPWYTIHKEFAGLIDAYRFCGDAKALAVATNFADWVSATTQNLTDTQWQKMLVCEQGGMNEAMANLYALTGNTNYLNLAEKFYHRAVMDPLARGDDLLDGLHSNMQIPKTIGAARLYELTGQPRYADIAKFFWDRVALHRSYVIGGNGDSEHFFPVSNFARHLDAATCETCCTYNMLKLTLHLFEWSPSAAEMDFYERALYNDILASQDPDTGMFVYLMSLQPGGFKTYSTPQDSFWCCVGSGMENHSRYGQAIYLRGDDSLYVNLFIASELSWPDKGLVVRQETKFPDQDTTRVTFQCRQPVKLALKIRWPSWAETLSVRVNGWKQKISGTPGSYVTIDRVWSEGDHVEVRLPMKLHLEPLPGTKDMVAVLYGPIVLAGELGTNGMPADPYAQDQTKFVRWPAVPVPVWVADESSLLKHIRPTGQPLTFRTKNLGHPDDVTLVPFYRVTHQRYTVYWHVLSPSAWRLQEAEIKHQWDQESARLAVWENK